MSDASVAIVYGYGSGAPSDIARAAQGLADLVFCIDPTDAHSSALEPYLGTLGAVCRVPFSSPARVARALREQRVDGVVTFDDRLVELVAQVAAEIEAPGHHPSVARRLRDKSEQRTALARVGVSPVRFSLIEDESGIEQAFEIVGGPAILKPLNGTGSKAVFRVNSIEEIHLYCRRYETRGPLLLEEELESGRHPIGEWLADYVSVESVAVAGEVTHFCVTDKRPLASHFRETGYLVPSTVPDSYRCEIEEFCTRALHALGVANGVLHTELKLSPSGLRVIEVNGRLGGAIHRLVSRSSDFNPIRAALCASLGSSEAAGPEFTGFAFHHWVQGPPRPAVVREIASPRTIRKLDGVWGLDMEARPGVTLDPANGSSARVMTIWAEASSVEEAHARYEMITRAGQNAYRYEV